MKKITKKQKILKNFKADTMKKQLQALRNGRPKIKQGLLDSKIGGFMKEKFKFKKDKELIKRYNIKISEANKILTKLEKRL